MKHVLTFLLIIFCVSASAQTRNMTRGVNDDGKTLKLTYKMTQDDKYVDYENSFDVQGLSKSQKDALVTRIIDSLNNTPAHQKKSAGTRNVKINDDGNHLTLTVEYRSNDQHINYTNTYDVKGKSKEEKDALVKKVLDGLGVK